MNLLLDACVWGGSRKALDAAGRDVIWVGDWAEDPGDEEILTYAHREGRVLVTLDKDFGELAIVRGQPHAGIIRLVGSTAPQQGPICLQILAQYVDDLESGAIITAEPGRIRVRSLPLDQADDNSVQ